MEGLPAPAGQGAPRSPRGQPGVARPSRPLRPSREAMGGPSQEPPFGEATFLSPQSQPSCGDRNVAAPGFMAPMRGWRTVEPPPEAKTPKWLISKVLVSRAKVRRLIREVRRGVWDLPHGAREVPCPAGELPDQPGMGSGRTRAVGQEAGNCPARRINRH